MVGSPARPQVGHHPLPHQPHPATSATIAGAEMHDAEGPSSTFASTASQLGSATTGGRRPMDVLPEEDIQPEERYRAAVFDTG